MAFRDGMAVVMHDPDFGDFPATVESVTDDGTVYLEGPRLGAGESRHWTWILGPDAAARLVTPAESEER